jgi:3-oxoacyl-[acyl-carrier-protein] synthase-3
VPHERVSFNVELTANTSAASIPLGLAAAQRDGRLPAGALVGIVAFGAGFVWGAGLTSWKDGAAIDARHQTQQVKTRST